MISFQLSERRFLKVVTWRTNEDTWSPGLAYMAIHVYTPPCTEHSAQFFVLILDTMQKRAPEFFIQT